MRNQTIKRLNILVAVLVVLALLLTFSAVAISAMAPSGTISGDSADNNSREMPDNIGLTDTNGTLEENTPLTVPDGYTGVKITSGDELKAFLIDADATTLKYGYIELAEGVTSINLDWGTNNGTNTVLTSNKIFDGRGYVVNLTTTPGNNADMARADLSSYITGENAITGSPSRGGGWFLAASYGTIKNTRFVYSQVANMQCKQEYTTVYGIVVGYNAGLVDNIKLTMTDGSKFYVDKQEPSGETSDTDRCTTLVGGIAGINIYGALAHGQVINSTAEINGTLSVQARFKGGKYSWNTQGSSRSSVAGLVARMQGLDSLVQNCSVTGGTAGNIKASTTGSGKNGTLYRHIATAVAANSDYSRTQGQAFGQINGVVDAYRGSIDKSTSGSSGGTFDCAENAINVYTLASRSISKRVYNCGCDHNKKSTYKTIDLFGANSHYKFTNNPGEVELTLDFTDEELARQPQVHEHKEYEMTAAEYVPSIAVTHENVTAQDTMLEKDYSYTIPADTAGSQKFISSYFSVYYNITLVGKQPSQPYIYNGNHQSIGYEATYVTGESAPVDELKINKQYSSRFAGSEEYASAENTTITGEHIVFAVPKGDGGILYESFGSNIILKDVRKNAFGTSYTIDKTVIATNNPLADTWYKEFQFSIDMIGYATGAFDKIEYSTDYGASWTLAEGSAFNVSRNGANVVHLIRAYKSNVLVTEMLSSDEIKFDNTVATISNVNYSTPINEWTTADIDVTFNAVDQYSGLKTVNMIVDGVKTALTATDGLYSFTMNAYKEYSIEIEDNVGNVGVVWKNTPQIDKNTPNVSIAATYKDADGNDTAYEHNTSTVYAGIKVTATAGNIGPSGYTASYAVVDADGNLTEYLPIEIENGVVAVVIKNEITDTTYRVRIVSGAGVEATADITLTIQKRKLAITNDNITIDDTIVYTKTYDGTNAIVGQDANVALKDLKYTDGTLLTETEAANLKLTAYYENADAGTDKAIVYVIESNGTAFDEFGVENDIVFTATGTILQKEVTINIAEHRREYGYDNTTQFNSTIEGLIGTDTIGYSLTATADKLSNVGIYNIVVDQVTGSNYIIVNATDAGIGKFIVEQRKVNVNFVGDLRVVYNKSEQKLTASYVDINGNEIGVTLKYSKEDEANLGQYIEAAPINAGKYKVEIVIADTNYIANGDVEIPDYTIAKQTLKVDVTGWTGDYDGEEHGATVLNPNGIVLAITYNGTTTVPVNAGSYHVDVRAAGYDNNYNIVDSTAEIVINKITLPKLVMNDITGVYNGNPYVLKPTAVGGELPAGTQLNYSISDVVNVGEYDVTVVVSNPNYFTQEITARITITKANITDMVSLNGKTVVYNGSEYKLDLTLAEGFILPDGITITWTNNNSLTNVGKNLVGVKITGDNYNSVTLEAWLEVTPAAIGEDIGFESNEMYFDYEGADITITLEGNLEGYDVKYDRNVLTYAGTHYVKATVSRPNYATKTFTTLVTVDKYSVELTYNNLPKDLKIKVGESLEGITASFEDLNGNVVEVKLTIIGSLTEEGVVSISAKMPGNYIADNGEISIEVVKGSNTAVIIGASVGGSVGGLAVIGGVAAFFIIKKKKSII